MIVNLYLQVSINLLSVLLHPCRCFTYNISKLYFFSKTFTSKTEYIYTERIILEKKKKTKLVFVADITRGLRCPYRMNEKEEEENEEEATKGEEGTRDDIKTLGRSLREAVGSH